MWKEKKNKNVLPLNKAVLRGILKPAVEISFQEENPCLQTT